LLAAQVDNAESDLLTKAAQQSLLTAQTSTEQYNLANILPKQAEMLTQQKELLVVQIDEAEYNLANLAPKQVALLTSQIANAESDLLTKTVQQSLLTAQKDLAIVQVSEAEYNLASILPKQAGMLTAQIDNATSDLLTKTAQRSLLLEQTNTEQYNLANILPKQASMLNTQIGNGNVDIAVKLKQRELVAEQIETQRAQTTDNRTDGSPVTGSVGKEKELHSQQILNFQREAEVRAAKLFTEAWITTKTVDESLLPPDAFNNISLQTILERVKTANGLNV
jgi:hypothetical protein